VALKTYIDVLTAVGQPEVPLQGSLLHCVANNLPEASMLPKYQVAQLAGYVSEHAAYHHGEASLAGTIVGLAQDFVGSNNVNLLVPSGE